MTQQEKHLQEFTIVDVATFHVAMQTLLAAHKEDGMEDQGENELAEKIADLYAKFLALSHIPLRTVVLREIDIIE